MKQRLPLLLLSLFLFFGLSSCGIPNFIDPSAGKKIRETAPTDPGTDPGGPGTDPGGPPPIDPGTDPTNPPIVEPRPPSTPELWQDHFLHQVPHGELDLLFVIHAKKKMLPFIDSLKEQSSVLLNSLIDPPTTYEYGGKFSFKMNVITSNSASLLGEDITATNAFKAGSNALSERLSAMPIEWGDIRNLSTEKLIEAMKSGYLRSGSARFFPILISNTDDEGQTQVTDLLNAIYSVKGKNLLHIFGLFFKPDSDSCNPFPYRRALRLADFIQKSQGNSFELCNVLLSPHAIIEKIVMKTYLEMSRKILTFQPHPAMLRVYVNGLKINESHWDYDPVNNEILFDLPTTIAQLGDKVDVVYGIKK